MSRIPLLVLLLAGAPLFADTVTLKDGRQISGSLESGNVEEIHVKVGDRSQTIDIHEVQTIQFGVSLPAPAAGPTVTKEADSAPVQPNTLILNDGTKVAGKWWAIDANNIHFLVGNQLQHYPRRDLTGVTFGAATLPSPPERSTTTPPAAAQAPASVAPKERAPTLARSSGSAPPSAAPRVLSQPEEMGAVYYWNGKGLILLEVAQAVAHKSGATEYWEMPGPQSRMRMTEAESLIFILRLPKGVDPARYSLFTLETVDGGRRTRVRPGRKGGLLTWPVDIKINDDTSLMTYALTVRDLPAGEYSFSPSDSNDSYCFGVDSAPPGQ